YKSDSRSWRKPCMKNIIRPSYSALCRFATATAIVVLASWFGRAATVTAQELATPTPSPADQTEAGEAQPVIVSATRIDIPLTESPATVSVVTSEDIEQKQI